MTPKDPEKLDKPARMRLEMLIETRRMMESGELPAEPDVGLKEGRSDAKVAIRPTQRTDTRDNTTSTKKGHKKGDAVRTEEAEDDFFESD